MREIRLSGSEGGGGLAASPYPNHRGGRKPYCDGVGAGRAAGGGVCGAVGCTAGLVTGGAGVTISCAGACGDGASRGFGERPT